VSIAQAKLVNPGTPLWLVCDQLWLGEQHNWTAALDQLEADGLLSIMEYSVRDVGGSERVVRVRMMPLIGMLDPGSRLVIG
jgi:hypothetical protein